MAVFALTATGVLYSFSLTGILAATAVSFLMACFLLPYPAGGCFGATSVQLVCMAVRRLQLVSVRYGVFLHYRYTYTSA